MIVDTDMIIFFYDLSLTHFLVMFAIFLILYKFLRIRADEDCVPATSLVLTQILSDYVTLIRLGCRDLQLHRVVMICS